MIKNFYLKKYQGFTILEVMVSVTILLFLLAIIMGLQYSANQSQLFAFQKGTQVDNLNKVAKDMVREIRTASYSALGTYPLEVLSDYELIFYSDIDYDGQIERVRYSLIGNSLEKGVINPTVNPIDYPVSEEKTVILYDNIANNNLPIFIYLNRDWPYDNVNNPLDELDRISQTQTIGINLSVTSSPGVSNTEFSIQTEAQIRILQKNL